MVQEQDKELRKPDTTTPALAGLPFAAQSAWHLRAATRDIGRLFGVRAGGTPIPLRRAWKEPLGSLRRHVITVGRTTVLRDAERLLAAHTGVGARDKMGAASVVLAVEFAGEKGLGVGVTKEFYSEVAKQL